MLCLSFLDVTTHTTLSTVCSDWLSLSAEDALWRDHYLNRFSGGGRTGRRRANHHVMDCQGTTSRARKSRLEDPHVGDDVEVAWRGKFRLESSGDRRGTAWWVAVVVDKVALDAASGSPGRGRKIHAARPGTRSLFLDGKGRWDGRVSAIGCGGAPKYSRD